MIAHSHAQLRMAPPFSQAVAFTRIQPRVFKQLTAPGMKCSKVMPFGYYLSFQYLSENTQQLEFIFGVSERSTPRR